LTPQIIDSVVTSTDLLIAQEGSEHLAERRDAAVVRILKAAITEAPLPASGSGIEGTWVSEVDSDMQYLERHY
jgi:hypothetical protein